MDEWLTFLKIWAWVVIGFATVLAFVFVIVYLSERFDR